MQTNPFWKAPSKLSNSHIKNSKLKTDLHALHWSWSASKIKEKNSKLSNSCPVCKALQSHTDLLYLTDFTHLWTNIFTHLWTNIFTPRFAWWATPMEGRVPFEWPPCLLRRVPLQEASAVFTNISLCSILVYNVHLSQTHVPSIIQGVTRWHDVIMSRSKPLIIIFTSAPRPLSCDLCTRSIQCTVRNAKCTVRYMLSV